METSLALVVSASEAARLCGVSRTQWWALLAKGKCPAPVRIGRKPLWRRAELVDWLSCGCPDLAHWQWPKGERRD